MRRAAFYVLSFVYKPFRALVIAALRGGGGKYMEVKRKKMKILSKTPLWAILTGVFALLLVVVIIGTAVTSYFAPYINSVLGASTSKIIRGDKTNTDTEYFKSDYAYDRAGEEKLIADAKEVYRSSVEEGSVLLKNENNALPLASTGNVVVFGGAANQHITGFKTQLETAGYTVNEDVWTYYSNKKGTSRTNAGIPNWDSSIDGMVTETGATAIVTFGRRAGEGTDAAHPGVSINKTNDPTGFQTENDYLSLSGGEQQMLEHVKAMKDAGKFSKIIVIITTSNMMRGDFIDNAAYGIDAAVWTGQASADYGTEGLVNILQGEVNPSGRLVDSIYMDNMDLDANPVMANLGNFNGDLSAVTAGLVDEVKTENYQFNANPQGNDWDKSVVYQEGVYLGYKYYETRYEDYVMGTGNAGDFVYDEHIAYPFGEGLSYTSWEYTAFTASEDDDNFTFNITVKNSGGKDGKHSVLIYMQSPYTDYDKENDVEKPAVQLVGFTKTGDVKAGASEDVTVTVPKYMMRAYDSNAAKTYILDAGDYYFTAAGSSHEAVNNILAAKGYTPSSTNNKMDAEGDKDAVYKHTESALDTEIFSASYATGNEITNRFDDVDPNKDVNASKLNDVKWVTRSDWTGTLPKTNVTIKYNDGMVELARPVTYVADPEEQKNTEMPKFGVANNLTLAMFMDVDYDDPLWYDLLAQMTYEETAKLVTNCWYGSDAVGSVGKNRQTDQDTSMGRTNPFTANPDLMGIAFTSGDLRAATFNKEIMKAIGTMTGENNLHASTDNVKAVGLYGFSPNIHRSPYSGRNGEYFSKDAYITGIACELAVSGMEEKGCGGFAKHFFHNDQEDSRHGIATWANEQTIRETYLPAFEYIITYGGSMGLMNSFNRIGMRWVGEHKGAQLDMLRDEWGFMGNIVTDLYEGDYQDVIDGLLAHTTMWLTTAADQYCYGLLTSDKYRNDPVIVTALVEAAHRMLYGSSRNASMNGLDTTDRIVEIMPWWQAGLIALIVIFAVLTAAGVTMTVLSLTVFKKRDARE